MSAHPVSVAVRPGEGVVARTGAAVMVVLPGGSDDVQRQLLDAFISACEGQATPGRVMARRLVGLLSQSEPDDVPSFGACAPNERGWAVILHHGVALRVDYGGAVTSLSGYDASTWVDRIVDDGFSALALGSDDADLTAADMRFRFDGGVIPGAGITIQPTATDQVHTPGTAGGDLAAGTAGGDMAAGMAGGAMAAAGAADPSASTMSDDEQDERRRASGARADDPADAMSSADAEPPVPDGMGGAAHDGMGQAAPGGMAQAAPLPERPVGPAPAPAAQQAPPAPVHHAPPAQQPPVQAPPAAAPAPLHGAIPTPTPDPSQQPGTQATPAQPDGGFFAKPAPSQAPPAQAPPAQPSGYQGTVPDEEEPPTLIQSSDRDAQASQTPQQAIPEDMPAEDVPFESVPLLDIGEDARRDALPVLSADTPKEDIEDSGAPLVYGVLSPTGYFNHPDALFCAVTGVSMLHRTHALVQRPRPPLGVVVADDGSTFTLNSDYVVGREPERDPQVEADQARPLKLQDAERSLSRVHAEIRLVDWDVVIVDRGSANGTYVLPRGGQQWKRLVADTPETIVPGTRVAFGKRVMTYESHHQINQAAAS